MMMVEVLNQPPPAEASARMASIPGVEIAPTMLATQRGPEGHLGPEAAGALLVLQVTFVDERGAAEFWMRTAELMELLATAPGFIRRFSFGTGADAAMLALWRTVADAHAFFSTDAHQAAMRDLFRRRWVYSHFAGLWETTGASRRVIFCPGCGAATSAPARVCTGCDRALHDPFL